MPFEEPGFWRNAVSANHHAYIYCFGEPPFGKPPFGKLAFGKLVFGELAGPHFISLNRYSSCFH
jgi:hypothetical protein